MSRVCDFCGRGPTSGQKKSHSNRKTKRIVGINVQVKKINGQKRKVCTNCLRTMMKKLT